MWVDPARWKCEHRHSGLEHPICYQKSMPQRIGYLDIETSNLKADFGVIYSWCIKYRGLNKFEGYVLKKNDYTILERDKEATRSLIIALGQFTTIVTYYGGNYQFDMPFLRTRALKYDFQFPPYKSLRHIDLYQQVRGKLKLHSNRLESVSEFLHLEPRKSKIDTDIWNRANLAYDKEALAYIWEHNKIDTILLEKLHEKIEPYMAYSNRSI